MSVSDSAPVLSGDMLRLVVRRLRVLAEPTRVRIVLSLSNREATVHELADDLDLAFQNVSKHLNVLHQADVLMRRPQGRCVRYAIADFTVLRLIGHASAGVTARIEELADIANARE
jgi:ArsR family transcriptional regulator, cadmium/lead-responsive transcriptional repressor